MERNLKEVLHEAAQLPERDRATLGGFLIETLDPASEPDVEGAWSEEIRRRVAEIDAGTVELIPWEEVRAELFGQPNESQAPVYASKVRRPRHFFSITNFIANIRPTPL